MLNGIGHGPDAGRWSLLGSQYQYVVSYPGLGVEVLNFSGFSTLLLKLRS